MNVHESESIEGMLELAGYQRADNLDSADVIVFNSCCVRQSAENRIYGNIGYCKALKKKNPNLLVILVGCMASKDGTIDKVQRSYPFVDIILGTGSTHRLIESIQTVMQNSCHIYDTSNQSDVDIGSLGIKRDNKVSGYINIMQGCDNFCTYCIVPYVRGREHSRDINIICDEVSRLVDSGYKEITLLGQNVNSYKDGTNNFATLLSRLDTIEGRFRLKYMTSHPKDMDDNIIDIIAGSRHIAHNVHLPLQAGSDRVLEMMNRKYTAQYYLDRVSTLRSRIKDISITTDIMVGFPSETDDEFAETMDIVTRVGFGNVFSFMYSAREGTPAAQLQPQIDIATKRRRIKQLIDTQGAIASDIAKLEIGKQYEVLCTQVESDRWIGKTINDRMVIVRDNSAKLGEFVQVDIVSVKNSGLIGTRA